MLDINTLPPFVVPYARVLGFNRDAEPLLKQIKTNSHIPLVTKLADAEIHPCLETDIVSAHIYESGLTDKYHTPVKNEYERQIVIIEQ